MNDGFLTYEYFYFVIKTSMKLVGFFYLFIFYDTFIFTQVFFFSFFFFFCANYCVTVNTNFSRCCGWLRFAAQPIPSRRLYCHNNNNNNNNTLFM